jgi:drug/metabolite transporter (DMT)-like permease
LAIAFISAVVAFPIQKIWERGKSTTYPGFGKLLVACILAAAFLALFQLQNLPGAVVTLLFGSGAMFTGVYVASRG